MGFWNSVRDVHYGPNPRSSTYQPCHRKPERLNIPYLIILTKNFWPSKFNNFFSVDKLLLSSPGRKKTPKLDLPVLKLKNINLFLRTLEIVSLASWKISQLNCGKTQRKPSNAQTFVLAMIGPNQETSLGLIRNGVFKFSRNTLIASCWMWLSRLSQLFLLKQ